jgi:hypothetical protein
MADEEPVEGNLAGRAAGIRAPMDADQLLGPDDVRPTRAR